MITITDRNISDISHQKQKTEVSLHCTRTELFHVKKANVCVKVYCDEGSKTTKTEKNLDLGIES